MHTNEHFIDLCTHTYVYADSKIFVGVSYVGKYVVDLVDMSVRDALICVCRK